MSAISSGRVPDATPPLAKGYSIVLVAILALFVILASAYNVVVPLFEGPDEAAHFLYIDYIAAGKGLPTLELSSRDVLWEGLQQPPLYYALAAILIGWIDTGDLPDLLWPNPHRGGETGGVNLYYHTARESFPYQGTVLAVHVARALNVLFGLATIVATFGAARRLSPRQPSLALGAAAVLAFNPQFVATSALVNNDIAAAAFCAVGTWLVLRALRRAEQADETCWALSWWEAVGLGSAVGLAAVTKPSGLLFTLPVALAIAALAWQRCSWRTLLRGWFALMLGVGLLSGWWYVRNLALFGDPLAWNGLRAIEAEVMRPAPIPLEEAFANSAWLQKSFWGVFGNGVLMDFAVYRGLEILMRLAALGLILWVTRQAVRRMADAATWLGLGFLCAWSALVYLALLRFMQIIDAANQGRLMFPATTALSILLMVGLSGFFPRRLTVAPIALVSAGLLFLSAVAPFWYIVPAYAQPPPDQRLAAADPAQGQQAGPAVPVRFGDGIELIGHRITPSEIKPGNVIHVTLDWRCLSAMDVSYKLFIHVLGFDGERLTQLDTIPYRGRFATLLWQPGQEFRDEYDLFITGRAKPSLARVQIGFFRWDDPAARVAVFAADGQPMGDHLDLATFKIAPKKTERPDVAQIVEADFGGMISLVGYDMSTPSARAGEPFSLVLYWQARSPDGHDYSVFVHVLNAEGAIVAQHDSSPQNGNYPTGIWAPGEFIPDTHTLSLPPDLPAGAYSLAVGLYRPQDGSRLPVRLSGQPAPDGRAIIGQIEVAK